MRNPMKTDKNAVEEVVEVADAVENAGEEILEAGAPLNDYGEDYQAEEGETTLVEYERELTEEDHIEYAKRIAALDDSLEKLENEKKTVNASFAGKIRENENERKELSRAIRRGYAELSAQCLVNPDYEAGKMVYTCIESGEVIQETEMTAADRQMSVMDIENEGAEGAEYIENKAG